MITLASTARGVSFAVRVSPRAGRTEVAGVRNDALHVRLASAPVDGAANNALIAFLSDLFGCPKRSVTIVSGQKSRDKRIGIDGVTAEAVAQKLSVILPT